MKKFKKFYIEITNVCNLSCSFCPKTGRAPQFMAVETFAKILEQITGYTDHIYFHVKGEPLLHPEIGTLLDLSYEKGFKVNITTNGTLIDKAKEKILMKPALRQVNFSLHSFDGNEKLEDADKYLDRIISFAREAVESTGTFIAMRLWNLSKSNQVNAQRNRNRHILEVIEREFDLPYKIEEKILPDRGIKISDRIYLNQDYEFKWPGMHEEEGSSRGFCHGLRNQVAVLVDGTVVPCCLDGEGIINLGNIHETHFTKIVDGERANNMFHGFSRHELVEELCRKCGYRERFSA
jgi:radical SAM protein with 4Fe4S-binding SPASM domain